MNLFTELKRRNVIRMGLLYVVSSWLILQVGDVLFEVLGVPDWSLKLLFAILLLGLPFALFFSWIYELTPEGLKKEAEVDRAQSMTSRTGKRLDRLIITVMGLVIVALLAERFVSGGFEEDRAAEATGETLSGGSEGDRATSWSVPANGATEAEPPGGATLRSIPDQKTANGNSIAVLPFENMSVDAANEFFADGISEEILNLLAGVDALEVASRTSSFAFKGKDTSIPQIADSLNVRYVLEGSVRKAGDQVRITAQLIDAQTDRHLWSDTFDRTLEDVFAVQDEIAAAIGDALQVRLLGEGGTTVTAETIDPDVYETFLEARFLMRRRSFEALQKAATMLETVVEAEPQFARGLVLLAEAYLLMYDTESIEQRSRDARILTERAAAINPRLSGVPMIQGNLAWRNNEIADAYRQYVRAIELDPEEPRPHHWMALIYSGSGYLDQALEQIDEAIRLEPKNANAHGWRSTIHAARGDWQAAVADARRQAELGNPTGHIQAGIWLLAANPDASEQEFRLARSSGEADEADAVSKMIELVKREPTLNEELVDRYRRDQSGDHYDMLQVLLVQGIYDAYLELRLNYPRSVTPIHTMVWNERAAEMRRDPRFVSLMERKGYTELWREIGPPPDCRAEGDTFVCGLTGTAQ